MSIKNKLFLNLARKKAKEKKVELSRAISQQALEPRLLLDAAAYSTLAEAASDVNYDCLLYTSPSPRDKRQSRMPSSA